MKSIAQDLVAAFSALTRIPLWHWVEVPRDHYKRVVYYWPVVGWLTGSLTALVIYAFAQFLPTYVAVTLGFIFRILLTGGIHEDGLMDFFDGFGGGRTRERILEIMKDSHSGAYAIIGFICYALLWIALVASMPLATALLVVAIADPISKYVSSFLPLRLPYARDEQSSKMGVVYAEKPSVITRGMAFFFGIAPLALSYQIGLAILVTSSLVVVSLVLYYKRKIGGYTGDCLGATFLISEIISYIAVWIVI